MPFLIKSDSNNFFSFPSFQSEDDMQSNFSHLSEAEFKSRLSELAECSDEEEEEEEEEEENSKPRESYKLAHRSKQ